jgi:hypothetical protein
MSRVRDDTATYQVERDSPGGNFLPAGCSSTSFSSLASRTSLIQPWRSEAKPFWLSQSWTVRPISALLARSGEIVFFAEIVFFCIARSGAQSRVKITPEVGSVLRLAGESGRGGPQRCSGSSRQSRVVRGERLGRIVAQRQLRLCALSPAHHEVLGNMSAAASFTSPRSHCSKSFASRRTGREPRSSPVSGFVQASCIAANVITSPAASCRQGR